MNILQLVPKLEVGGVEKGTVDLARYLMLHAHKAVVVSEGGGLVKKLDEAGVRHYTLPIGRKNPFTIGLMVFKLVDIIKKENIHIVHARSRVPAIAGFIASRMTQKVFITTAHGHYKKHLISYIMGWGKIVIVASPFMSRYMGETFGIRPDKLRIIPRGVDTNKFKFVSPDEKGHKGFTIGMISRITPLKGHEDFIRAVSLLSRKIPNLYVYIVGKVKGHKTDYMKNLELLVKRMSLTNVVKFSDKTDDVPSLLKGMDVVVSANRKQEAFGRVIIEAQSSGVPCVATSVGGVIDIIDDNETGLLCEPGNPKDMADKIMRLYKDMSLRVDIAKRARKVVEEKYGLEHMITETMKVYEEAQSQIRILILKTSALGDVILNIPSIRAIRQKYPDAMIKMLVGIECKDVVRHVPYIDELIVCDFNNRDRGLRGLLRIAHFLKGEDFDMVVDFQNNKKSHALGFLSCAGKRCGYDNGKLGFLLNRKVKDMGIPMDPISHQMKVLGLLGIHNIDKALELFTSDEDNAWAQKFLIDNWIKPDTPFVCMHMESSERWISKRWPVENFVKIAEKLAKELSIRVLITGQHEQDEWNQTFFKMAKCSPVSAVEKTSIGNLLSLIKRSSVLVTSDSAPMHIAAGVETPFVALFGPTDPKRHAPTAKACRVLKQDLECGPCYKPVCGRGYTCMSSISVDDVFSAVKEMLGK